jgi:electron transfer flavoprotein beta subunit
MKIAVCLKQVLSRDEEIYLDQSMPWIQERNARYDINEADSYALEEALRLKEQEGGQVLLVSLGPDRVCTVLKDGLAKGADRAIHICTGSYWEMSTYRLANTLGSLLHQECVDLVLVGMQSDDRGNGQLAPNLGRSLAMPHATLVSEITVDSDKLIRLKRELEGGRVEELVITRPCVLSIQSGINKPRYASMKGIMTAKKKTIESKYLDKLDNDSYPDDVMLTRMYLPAKNTECRMIDGNDAAEVANVIPYLKSAVAS